ncbi:MAG TPA: carboxymuconolactone decarboxylase family protein [Stellaceae bacterium]|nr:carboxymuconolactone decarboxylase family protein [Stellaceae bacterium]
MARVRDIGAEELPAEARAIYERFTAQYGPFRNQVAVFAHYPPAVTHLMGLLLEMRASGGLKRRHLELALVAVSKLNECHYCVAHHRPMLMVEGLSAAGVDRLLDYEGHPELDETDRLVVEYAVAVTRNANRIRDEMFERLRRHFDESQIVQLTLRIALCGFFNRFNDALQIEEEAPASLEHA